MKALPAILQLSLLATLGCASTPQAPATQPAAPPPTYPSSSPVVPFPTAAAPPTSTAPPQPGTQLKLTEEDQSLVRELELAEGSALNAGQDCTNACRALKSMQRAAARLCSLARNEDEKEVCRRAEARVRAARERVRASCHLCPNGPSLDPNAPVTEP